MSAATSEQVTDTIYDPSQIIPLQETWVLWYHHTLNDWTIDGYKDIWEFRTTKDFWDFHNNLELVGNITNLHFFLMRKGIEPRYEDPRNRTGGCWSFLGPQKTELANEFWTRLAVNCVIEKLVVNNKREVNGISVNIKSGRPVFKIWNTSRHNSSDSLLPDYTKKYGDVLYQVHKS